jgi:micrococcal nuclease
MRYDYQFHRQNSQATFGRGKRNKGRGGLVLMLLAAVFAGLVIERAVPELPLAPTPPSVIDTQFGLCFTGGRQNCVVDGDTFWMAGEKIRIADIDTPETHPSRCALEADLGGKATLRLQALLNAGPVTLASADRDTDRYGRKLRIVERGGQSLGDTLVAEGLARPWTGRRRPWCV